MGKLSDNARYLEIIFPWHEELCSIQPELDPEETSIPLVANGYWHGTIDLKTHRLQGCDDIEPMNIQAKVCDEGIYILHDEHGPLRVLHGYVPKLPFGEDSFGDYIHIEVSHTGAIENWNGEVDFSEFIESGQPISTEQYLRTIEFYNMPATSGPSKDEIDLVELAAKIMVAAHKGQTDKSGQPYIFHPMRVAVNCDTLPQKTVALLHDVLEDTPITQDFLREEGFSEEIIDAIQAVTRRPDETYNDFIIRCSLNPIGRQVKIRDLEDNLNVMRLSQVTPKAATRLSKYLKSLRFLKSVNR